jgi:hypothetical protein
VATSARVDWARAPLNVLKHTFSARWLQVLVSACVRIRVRRSFSVETMRKLSKIYFASKRKKSVFSLVSLRSEKLEIRSETKAREAKIS